MRSLVVVGLFVVVTTCRDTGTEPSGPAAPATGTLSKLEMSPAAASLVVGDTVHFTVAGVDAAGRSIQLASVDWRVSSPSASISADGLLTATAPGDVSVLASSGTQSVSANVTVTSSAMASMHIVPAQVSIQPKGITHLSVDAVDSYGNVVAGGTVAWQSSDPTKATVDQSGAVTGVSSGAVLISAQIGSTRATSTVLVNTSGAVLITVDSIIGGAASLRVASSSPVPLVNRRAIVSASTEIPQFVFVLDAVGATRGIVVTSVVDHAITVHVVDATSTAVGLLASSLPSASVAGSTDSLTARLGRLSSFRDFAGYLTARLSSASLESLLQDPTLNSLMHQAVVDFQATLGSSTNSSLSQTARAGVWVSSDNLFTVTRTFASKQLATDQFANQGYRFVTVWQRDLDAHGAEIGVHQRFAAMGGGSYSFIHAIFGQGLLSATTAVQGAVISQSPPATEELWIVGPGVRAGLPLPPSIPLAPSTENLAMTVWSYLVAPAVSGVVGDIVSPEKEKTIVKAAEGLTAVGDLGDALIRGDAIDIIKATKDAVVAIGGVAGKALDADIPQAKLIFGSVDVVVFVGDWLQEARVGRIVGVPAATGMLTMSQVSGGGGQTGAAGSVLPIPLTVKVIDPVGGGAVAGIEVYFSSPDGGRFVSSTAASATNAGNPAVTDQNGMAEVYWSLGNRSGTQSAAAAAPWMSLTPVQFTALATSGAQSGQLAINATGLSAGISPHIVVTGPAGYSQILSGVATTVTVTPGTYIVTASTVSSTTQTCTPTLAVRQGTVVANTTTSVSVVHSCATTAGATASLGATPLAISPGQTSILTWSSTNATSCVGDWTQSQLAASGTAVVAPSQTTTYSVSCSGSPAALAIVTVVTATPTISQVSPPSIQASTTALNTLTITGANFSTSGGHLQFTDPQGNSYSSGQHPERVVAVSPTQWMYQINNGGATGTWQVLVVNSNGVSSNPSSFAVVSPSPTSTLSASPGAITLGNSTTLTWTSTNATSCAGTWSGVAIGVSGTATVTPTQTTTYSVTCSGSSAATAVVTVNSVPTLVITTAGLNPATATVGTAYSAQQAVTPAGGTPPYTWSVTGQPNGMSINATTGTLFGTPTVDGTFSLTVTVRDAGSPQQTAAKTLTLVVVPIVSALSITTTSLPDGMVGTAYSQTLQATGGTGSYSWSIVGGAGVTPTGLALSASGVLSGTPTTAQTANFSVQVTSGGQTASHAYSVTIAPPAPTLTVTTLAASNVTLTSFRMNGSVNPNGVATSGYFEWGTSATLSTVNVTSAASLGAGTAAISIQNDLTGALCGTTYYFRAVAVNATNAIGRGSIVSVATAACVAPTPTVSLGANPLSITAGQSTTLTWSTTNASLCVGNWVNYPTGGQVATSGTAVVTPGGTTDYNIVCSGAGTNPPTANATVRVTVAAAPTPTVTTLAAANVTSSGFQMNGSINPNGVATQGYFQYGTSATMSSFVTTGSASLGAGTSAVGVTAPASAMNCGTTFYFRAVAAPTGGSLVLGNIVSVTTAACVATPTVSLGANPTSITAGQSTTLTWSTTNASLCVGNWVNYPTGGQVATSGTAVVTPGGTTDYNIVCSGAGTNPPTANATVRVTVAAAQPPSATTGSASSVSKTGFQMNGTINPNGVATSGYFEWSTSASLNPLNTTSVFNAGSGTSNVPLLSTLSGGLCGTYYYYRVVAVSATGNVVRGSIMNVKTLAC